MKTTVFILTLIIGAYAVQQVLPWWSLVVVAALLAFFFKLGSWNVFLAAFAAGALLWGAYAYYLNEGSNGKIAQEIGALLNDSGPLVPLFVTAMIGALLASLGALIGNYFRRYLKIGLR